VVQTTRDGKHNPHLIGASEAKYFVHPNTRSRKNIAASSMENAFHEK
jgi:hypothetical protein